MDSLTHAVPPAPTSTQQERGFTLTEMAVVMVIVAILIGGLLLPLETQRDIGAHQETERTLAEIRQALIGFAVINGRLPRPAVSAIDGTERGNCDDNPGDATYPDCHGYIPWAVLGVEKTKTDSWGKLIRYSVTPDFANQAVTLTAPPDRRVQTRDSSGNPVYLVGQNTCGLAAPCAPAIIFSHGKNRWGTTAAGMALPDDSATNSDEDTNNNDPINYFSRLPTSSTAATGGEFDDIVVWLPHSILIHNLISAGRLP